MNIKEITEILVFTFLNHKHKWISINRLSKEADLPFDKVKNFIENTDLVVRAKKKNRKGEVLYALNDKAKKLYKLEKIDVKAIFSETKELLLAGKLQEAIRSYYEVLKNKNNLIPDPLSTIYKNKLTNLANEYFILEELWKSEEITNKERFSACDKFTYKLYESIIEVELILKELNKYRFRFKNVSIKINQDYKEFGRKDSDRIIEKVSNLLGVASSNIHIKGIEEGSVVMTLEFEDSTQAETLFLLIKLGKLKEEGIMDARLKELSEKIAKQKQNEEAGVLRICREAKLKIREGEAELAIELLINKFDVIPEEFHNETILLSSEMATLNKKAILSMEGFENIRVTRNKITFSLLNLIDRIRRKMLAIE